MLGGVSTVCHKKHLQSSDSLNQNKHILYLDITNLYGKAMTFKLPSGDFEEIEDFNQEDIQKILGSRDIKDQSFDEIFEMQEDFGYVLEVDLIYPKELFELHIGLPLAPEHLFEKLIPSLRDRYDYKIHYTTLKVYMKLGLVLNKVHKIYRFKQSFCIFSF